MTDRDDLRAEKALQGADFPAGREELLSYAQTRDADAKMMQALRTIPDRTYQSMKDVLDQIPQEPEGTDAPGGTAR